MQEGSALEQLRAFSVTLKQFLNLDDQAFQHAFSADHRAVRQALGEVITICASLNQRIAGPPDTITSRTVIAGQKLGDIELGPASVYPPDEAAPGS